MNLNLDKHVTDNGKCENCKNQGICKYSEEFKKVDIAVSEIKTDFISPIKVNICCSRYEKKAERQDEFYIR